MKPQWILFLLVLNIVYNVFGAICFSYLEFYHDQETVEAAEVVARILDYMPIQASGNVTCLQYETFQEALLSAVARGNWSSAATFNSSHPSSKWSVLNSAYFCFTVVTTIGYGNMSPSTSGGQLFFIFYAVVGIPLMLVFLAYVGFHINNLNQKLADFMDCFENPTLDAFVDTIVICSLGVAFFVLVPAGVFCYTEGWSYETACYYAVVTMSTVGFGDYTTGSRDDLWYRLLIFTWTLLGLAWFAGIISNIQLKCQHSMDQYMIEPPTKDPIQEQYAKAGSDDVVLLE